MPELPEVETIRRGLETRLVERIIKNIEVRAPKIFQGDPQDIVGARIISLERFGKLLVFRLEGENVLTIHLKMTGQLIWKPAIAIRKVEEGEEIIVAETDNAELPYESDADDDSEDDEIVMGGHPEKAYLQALPHKHTHIIMTLDDGSTVYFNDLRKFGRFTVMSKSELPETAFIQTMGPEPLGPDFTHAYLADQLKKRGKAAIKTFLLDQANVAGLGNIYADESLFRAAILPDRLAGDLKVGEVHNLYDSIQETLELALRHGGSSSKDYVNSVGERGTFLKIANVYHRTGMDCNRCDTGVIRRKVIGGRSSHYCPVCQY
jgi:formamidopyrimidine-DNA glycosylase